MTCEVVDERNKEDIVECIGRVYDDMLIKSVWGVQRETHLGII